MHTLLSNVGPVLVLFAIVVVVCIRAARNVYRSGVEYQGSRILLLSAIINTALVAFLLLLLSIVGLVEAWRFGGVRPLTLAVALALFLLPIRVLWNCLTMTLRLERRFGLRPRGGERCQREVVQIAKVMGIPTPSIMSSPSVRTPFVYGASSRSARLAVPIDWDTGSNGSRRVMLCHELAHIRNQDVGFLTWSFAFLRDLRWLLLSSPVIVILSQFTESEYLPQATLLYGVCLSILWVLTIATVKHRELLADATVAMLIDSARISQTINEVLLTLSNGLWLSATESVRTISRVRDWLADKALFSRRAKPWRALLRLFEASVSTHPSSHVRLMAISDQHTVRAYSSVRRRAAFWAGVALGLLGVSLAMGGFWVGRFLLGWLDDEQVMRLCYDALGYAGPLAIGFIALFFVLPTWSSIRGNVLARRSLRDLVVRYLYGLVGACCVSPLILVGGWSHIEIKVLLVLDILWVLVMLGFGISTDVVMLTLWLSLRYKQRHFVLDFVWGVYSYGLGILAVFGYLVVGMILLFNGQVLAGASITLGLLIGMFLYTLVIQGSVVSGSEQYLVVVPPASSIRVEAGKFRQWSPLIGSLHMIVLGLVPAVAVSAITYLLGHGALRHMGALVVLVFMIPTGCAILVILAWLRPRSLRENCRRKIHALAESLTLLGRSSSIQCGWLINKHIHTIQGGRDPYRSTGAMTTEKMFELTRLASPEEHLGCQVWEQARQWALACDTGGGFGPWPQSIPRLSSTYQCLQILQKTGYASWCELNNHILWLTGIQSPNGSFQGPWSKRPRWEDTFFAVASLGILGAELGTEARTSCLRWARNTLISEGIGKGQLDALSYCLAILDALHAMDKEIISSVYKCLSVELDRLLLTNIAHNAENIHHVASAYRILKERGISLVYPERMTLLADRVNEALEAELAVLRT